MQRVQPIDGVTVKVPRRRTLTKSEERALELFSKGESRARIARELKLSTSTIGHLLTSAKEKLEARTLAHAAALYVLQQKNGSTRPLS
jgi:DNA-binding CsgD family transcriptional regulator